MALEVYYADRLRNALLQAYEDEFGPSPIFRYFSNSGVVPVPADAGDGVMLVEFQLPANWRTTPSGGESDKLGTWQATAVAAGEADYGALYEAASPRVCLETGNVTEAFPLVTNGTTGAGLTVLNFANTAAVVVGQSIVGDNIQEDTTVFAKTSTTVTMDKPTTTGVGSGATVYFGDTSGRFWLADRTISPLQILTFDSALLIAPFPS